MSHRLIDLCEFIVDCEHKTAPLADDGYPSIRTPNVGRGRLLLKGVNRVSEETYRKWSKRATPQPNDIIIAREAPVGNAALIRPGQTVCLGQRTVLVRPDPDRVSPGFLVYFLLSDYCQDRFRAVSQGATVPHLNMKDIRELPLPALPPRDVQDRIAHVLSRYDDLIEVNERRGVVLEEMSRHLFDEWFTRRLPTSDTIRQTSLSSVGWKAGRLADFVSEVRDSVLPSDVDPDTRYIGLEHLPRRSTTLSEFGRAGSVTSTKLRFQPGDILFGKIRPYFHKVAYATWAGVTSSDTIVVRPKDRSWTWLALGLMSSDQFVAHAVTTSNGTKMPRANWTVLQNYPLHHPAPDVLEKFNAISRPAAELCATISEQNAKLEAARDLLLPRLITGSMRIGADIAGSLEAA